MTSGYQRPKLCHCEPNPVTQTAFKKAQPMQLDSHIYFCPACLVSRRERISSWPLWIEAHHPLLLCPWACLGTSYPLVSLPTHLLVQGDLPSTWHFSASLKPRHRCLLLTTWEDSSPQGAPIRCVLASGPRQLAKKGRKCSKYSPSSNSKGEGGHSERPFYSESQPCPLLR